MDSNESVLITGRITGNDTEIRLAETSISTSKLSLKGNTVIDLKNGSWNVSSSMVDIFFRDLHAVNELIPIKYKFDVPKEVDFLQNFRYKGFVDVNNEEAIIDGNISSSIGSLDADVVLKNYQLVNKIDIKGKLKSTGINLESVVPDQGIGNAVFDLNVHYSGHTNKRSEWIAKGTVNSVVYNGAEYENIRIDSQNVGDTIKGDISISNSNIELSARGKYDLDNEGVINVIAEIKRLDLQSLGITNQKMNLSSFLNVHIKGKELDDITGEINFENLEIFKESNFYTFTEGAIELTDDFGQRNVQISLVDDFGGQALDASAKGNYNLTEVQHLVQNALNKASGTTNFVEVMEGQRMDYNIQIGDAILEIILPDLILDEKTFIKGSFIGDTQDMITDLKSTGLIYSNQRLDGIDLKLNTALSDKHLNLSVDRLKLFGYPIKEMSLKSTLNNQELKHFIKFDGGYKRTEKFRLNFSQLFDKEQEKISVKIHDPSFFVVNKNKWSFKRNSQSTIDYFLNTKNINISDFDIYNEDGKLNLTAKNLENENIFKLNAQNVLIEKLFPKREGLSVGGVLNGNAFLKQNGNQITPKMDFSILDLNVNQIPLGDFKALIESDSTAVYKIDLFTQVEDKKIIDIKGTYTPTKLGYKYDFKTKLNHLKIDILESFLVDVLDNMEGEINGDLIVRGNEKNMGYRGKLALDNGAFDIPYLGVEYEMPKTVDINIFKNNFSFSEFTLRDKRDGSSGQALLDIYHKNFTDWNLGIDIDSKNLLVLNTSFVENELYYGKAFFNGYAQIFGPVEALSIKVVGKTNPGTQFYLPIQENGSISDYTFIKFLPPKVLVDERFTFDEELEVDEVDLLKGLNIELNIEVTPDALAEISFDPSIGDAIRGRGRGDLLMKINTLGQFDMYGELEILEGDYLFTLEKIINKKFLVKDGGTISWSGDPYNAKLDLYAVYPMRTSVSDYLELDNYNANIDLELLIHLKESLLKPDIDEDIIIPNAGSLINSMLEARFVNKDEKRRQFVSLLALRSFNSERSNTVNRSLQANGYELLSNQLSNILDKAFDNVEFGVRLNQGNDLSNTSDELDVNLGAKITDKLSIKTNVDIPVGSQSNNSRIIGEYQIERTMNKAKTLKLKTFSRQNRLENFNTNQGNTFGIGLSYQTDFDNFKELKEKLFKKKKRAQKDTLIVAQDSVKIEFN